MRSKRLRNSAITLPEVWS